MGFTIFYKAKPYQLQGTAIKTSSWSCILMHHLAKHDGFKYHTHVKCPFQQVCFIAGGEKEKPATTLINSRKPVFVLFSYSENHQGGFERLNSFCKFIGIEIMNFNFPPVTGSNSCALSLTSNQQRCWQISVCCPRALTATNYYCYCTTQ